jgi:hypothetical protein
LFKKEKINHNDKELAATQIGTSIRNLNKYISKYLNTDKPDNTLYFHGNKFKTPSNKTSKEIIKEILDYHDELNKLCKITIVDF